MEASRPTLKWSRSEQENLRLTNVKGFRSLLLSKKKEFRRNMIRPFRYSGNLNTGQVWFSDGGNQSGY